MKDPSHPRATGTEYADQVRAVLEQAERFDGASGSSSPEGSWARQGLLWGLFLVLVAVVGYNVVLLRKPPEPPPAEEVRRARGVSVLLATRAVEAYRDEHGRLPASLEEAGLPPGILVYEVTGDDYRLTLPEGDGPAASAEDPLDALRELGITPEAIR